MAPPTSAQDRTFIIGISGSPFSGKTTLANNLIKEISLLYNVDVLLLSQLDYHSGDEQGATMDPFLFTPSNRDEKNWRNIADPKCIRPVFYDVIKTMVELGKCYHLCKTISKGFPGLPKLHFDRVVIVEGPLLFHDASPLKNKGMFDLKIFLDVGTPEKALARRAMRPEFQKVQAPWKYWLSKDYFDKIIWPTYKRLHRQFLNGDGPKQGVDIENQERTAAQTAAWAKGMAQKLIAEQQLMWGTG